MLNNIGVEVLEFIAVNELCEFEGREKLADRHHHFITRQNGICRRNWLLVWRSW